MATVLIATEKPFAPDAREKAKRILREGGLEVRVLEKYAAREELIDALDGVQGVIVRSDRIDKDAMAASQLRLIVRAGAGVDKIDCRYAEEEGIVVENTPGLNANGVNELVFRLMSRAIRPLSGKVGRELKGKRLGIHGCKSGSLPGSAR